MSDSVPSPETAATLLERLLERGEHSRIRFNRQDSALLANARGGEEREVTPVRPHIDARVPREEQGRKKQRLLWLVAPEEEDLPCQRIAKVAPERDSPSLEDELGCEWSGGANPRDLVHERIAASRESPEKDSDCTKPRRRHRHVGHRLARHTIVS